MPFKKNFKKSTSHQSSHYHTKTEGMHVQVFLNTWQEGREGNREGPFLTLLNFSQS